MKMNLVDRLRDHLASEEGKESIKTYFAQKQWEKQVNYKWGQKFWNLTEEKKNEIIEKLVIKYSSDKYYFRWINRGIEPPEELLFVLFKFSEQTLNPLEIEEDDWFCTGKYQLTDLYTISRLDGQGTCIIIEKYEN